MSGKAVDNINVTADCGAKGVILPGKSTVHVDTEYVEGKRRCTGNPFQNSLSLTFTG